jgi:uncharacterized protein with FMN-binding domain
MVCVFFTVNSHARSAARNITIQRVDIAHVINGVYTGAYAVLPVKVSVQVTVADGKITGITILKHQNGLGGKAEGIVDAVMRSQRLDVDTISGATVSSKAILKAIENALQSGKE